MENEKKLVLAAVNRHLQKIILPRFCLVIQHTRKNKLVNEVGNSSLFDIYLSLFIYIGPEKPQWGVANYVYIHTSSCER